MKYYKVTKGFQGGPHIYYAQLRDNQTLTKENWQYQLENWGENTTGGHSYGYRIKATRVKKLPNLPVHKQPWYSPDANKVNLLKFKDDYLTKGKAK